MLERHNVRAWSTPTTITRSQYQQLRTLQRAQLLLALLHPREPISVCVYCQAFDIWQPIEKVNGYPTDLQV